MSGYTRGYFAYFDLIGKMALNQQQKVALDIVASGHNLCICGQAGTGKTHTITEIVRVCREKGSGWLLLPLQALLPHKSQTISNQ